MDKQNELKKYKRLATGLFLLMACIFISMLYAIHIQDSAWMHYVKAFSEAAMVGALADWFAVTALFRYPMGIKIPHTNLIESNKDKIGSNLGDFVTDNFLTANTIRPYIEDLEVSKYIISWIDKPNTVTMLSTELAKILQNILNSIDKDLVISFAHNQLQKNISNIPFAPLVSQGVQFALDNKEENKIIDAIVPEIRSYVINNKSLIYKKVVEKQPLLGLIGGKSVTNQLIAGLQSFLTELEEDHEHPIRKELAHKIWLWSEELVEDSDWQKKFVEIVSNYMNPETTQKYISDIWNHLSVKVNEELTNENSPIRLYMEKWLLNFKVDFKSDLTMQSKLNLWVQHSLYRLILKNTKELSKLIEGTVANWDGKELSEKLELEVGKDLQFIRVNGTIVGGMVGLLIYIVTQFFL